MRCDAYGMLAAPSLESTLRLLTAATWLLTATARQRAKFTRFRGVGQTSGSQKFTNLSQKGLSAFRLIAFATNHGQWRILRVVLGVADGKPAEEKRRAFLRADHLGMLASSTKARILPKDRVARQVSHKLACP